MREGFFFFCFCFCFFALRCDCDGKFRVDEEKEKGAMGFDVADCLFFDMLIGGSSEH